MSEPATTPFFTSDAPQGVQYTRERSSFRFDYLLSKKSDLRLPVLVLFNGAVDRSRAPEGVVFQRSSWASEISANLIFVNDGCLVRDPRARLAWAQGSSDFDYLEGVATDLQELITCSGWNTDEIYFYGSSGGGFQALQLAAKMPVSRALVNNPQTDWHRYEISHAVRRANILAYGTESLSDSRNLFAGRISVMESYRRASGAPRIRYMLNAASQNDYREQFVPFVDSFSNGDFALGAFEAVLYSNPELGHSPLGKRDTLVALETLLSGK